MSSSRKEEGFGLCRHKNVHRVCATRRWMMVAVQCEEIIPQGLEPTLLAKRCQNYLEIACQVCSFLQSALVSCLVAHTVYNVDSFALSRKMSSVHTQPVYQLASCLDVWQVMHIFEMNLGLFI